MPFFTSQANTYRAQVGNSVTLFCQVENLGKSFIILNSIEAHSVVLPYLLPLPQFLNFGVGEAGPESVGEAEKLRF